jgi:L-cysteine S-thiosulfotransferase
MKRALACAAVLALTLSPAAAQQKSPYADYQKKTTEAAPLELFELVGEELWNKKQGPKSASLEQCDLGQGPGKLKGAYARLPRYFKDTGEVMDLESRLVHCMMSLQGRSREEILKRPFGNADKPSELEYLSMYVARQSNGFKIDPGTRHPKEKEAYALGEKLFSWRTGLWDFSCTSCHGEEGKRIRASELPQLDDPKQVSPLIATWPAYRVSTSSLITLQWRMNNCFQQMRTAEPIFGSETVNSLITYLTVKSKGATYSGPGIKR